MLLHPVKNYLRRRRLHAAGFIPGDSGPTFRGRPLRSLDRLHDGPATRQHRLLGRRRR